MRPRVPRLVLLLCSLAVALAVPAYADEVQLANGDRITGQLVSLASGTLTFNTDHGQLYIPWYLVTRLAVDAPVLVATLGADPPTAAARAAGDAASGLTLDPGGVVAFPQITAITRPAPTVVFDGGANAGFIRSGGNSHINSLRLDGALAVRAGANRYTSNAVLTRAHDRGVQTARNWSTSLKYDRFVTSQLFMNANIILANDQFRELDLRTALGAGVGFQVFDTRRTKLTTDAGIGWVDENLRLQPGDRYTAVRESAAFELFIVMPDRLQVFHNHDGYFSVTGDDNMFVRTQNGVRIGLVGGFVTTTRLDIDYDRAPAVGRGNIDRTFAITLGYQF
jgi:putative salt-induced outer membrane protein YdiY